MWDDQDEEFVGIRFLLRIENKGLVDVVKYDLALKRKEVGGKKMSIHIELVFDYLADWWIEETTFDWRLMPVVNKIRSQGFYLFEKKKKNEAVQMTYNEGKVVMLYVWQVWQAENSFCLSNTNTKKRRRRRRKKNWWSLIKEYNTLTKTFLSFVQLILCG